MKLLTKAVERKLPRIHSTEPVPLAAKKVVVRFFTPDGWTWYAIEGQRVTDGATGRYIDFEFFGLVDSGIVQEWGYFHLSELTVARGPWGLPVERDRWLPKGATIGSLEAL